MVRQFHLRTQGVQESSTPHPDVIGDRFVSIGIWVEENKTSRLDGFPS